MKTKYIVAIIVLVLVLFEVFYYGVQGHPFPRSENSQYGKAMTLAKYHDTKEFTKPKTSNNTVIVGATIKRVDIPQCENCYADIFKSIDGVSDEAIIKINGLITAPLFLDKNSNYVDVRISENRKNIGYGLEDVKHFQAKILYVKDGVIGYTMNYNIKFTDVSFYNTANNLRSFLVVDADGKTVSDNTDLFVGGISSTTSMYSEEYVLDYFYPKGQKLVEKYSIANSDFEPCYTGNDFPGGFSATLHPETAEVVYENINYYMGDCQKNLQIPIKIKDILNELPEYIPKDSILWKFK